MKKEFVTYELLTELKELGLNVTQTTTISQVFRWFEENYSYFVDIKTDTTPNEILGFDYTIKSWKFPPIYFDFFNNKREGNIAVIKKMIEMVKKEKQREALIKLMDNDKDFDNNN